jgi:hydrogenase maturation protease
VNARNRVGGDCFASLAMSVNKECSRSARAGRVLVAGMGNILRRDDGFGVEMARQLAERDELPAGARVIEVGIGGIHLVQELIDHYDVLVVIDAVERGRAAGTVYLLEPAVPDLAAWPVERRQDFLADMHYATPAKALILAKALGVLPPRVFIVGCQPACSLDGGLAGLADPEAAGLGIGLSEPVRQAVPRALQQLRWLLGRLLAEEQRIDRIHGSD